MPSTLRPARSVIARLVRELPAPDNEVGDTGARPHSCWLSRSGGAPGAVEVRVGRHVIATLPTEHEPLVNELIAVHGGPRNAVDVIADLHGLDPSTAFIELTLPDRP